MKRSEINNAIDEAILFFNQMQFRLPVWSFWSLSDWKQNEDRCRDIFNNQLGWDLTDFGRGDFKSEGLLLFTIRNGNPDHNDKTYAEKIMIVEENQVTPMHFHWSKMEDIINRGGGNLIMQLFSSDENEDVGKEDIEVSIDGIKRIIKPGDTISLHPGESITLYQGLYHKFYGEPGKGKVLVGEVSAVNDDHHDNRFREPVGRFPGIDEDVMPKYLLVGDYEKFI
ncbi:MAG: D-lyxose/D-mannose family sugar isomerase [Bacteroidales bacterium]|nr:D-lyxose/D-mannose family sugar isomerase [Bacteroidales bacterium]